MTIDVNTNPRDAFDNARFLSLLNDLKSFFARRENTLLSFDKVSKSLSLKNQRYLGIKAVPTDKIIGSVDRYKDFDSHFLPKKEYLGQRWSKIYKAYEKNINLPLVQLYKVGSMYFVVDGNHRVSVARKMGVKYIDAEVTEFTTKVPLDREMDPKDIFLLAERENFLDITNLRETRPKIKIRLTIPGKYDRLLNQINEYMYYLYKRKGTKIDFPKAAELWYDHIYIPARNIIENSGILRYFPNRTKSDLYVWIYEQKERLEEKYKKHFSISETTQRFSKKYSRSLISRIKLFFSKLFNS
ncbi:MAG: hypothetical protein R6U35_06140 [Candidatus Humimicrobiaceae bacterium]